jgi:hypothetical protein
VNVHSLADQIAVNKSGAGLLSQGEPCTGEETDLVRISGFVVRRAQLTSAFSLVANVGLVGLLFALDCFGFSFFVMHSSQRVNMSEKIRGRNILGSLEALQLRLMQSIGISRIIFNLLSPVLSESAYRINVIFHTL